MTRAIWWVASIVLVAIGSVSAQSPQETWCGSWAEVETATCKIERRLNAPMSCTYRQTPLTQIIEDLNALSGISISLDEAALAQAGLSTTTPLTVQLDSVPFKSALNILLKKVDLRFVIRDQALVITTSELARGRLKQVTYPVAIRDQALVITTPESGRGRLKQVTYPVAELIVGIENGPRPVVVQLAQDRCGRKCEGDASKRTYESDLIHLITSTIAPDSWVDNGGTGSIQFFPRGMALVIDQTADVHEQIVELLSTIRRAQDIDYREYHLVLRMVEGDPRTRGTVKQYPKVTFVREQLVRVSIGESVALKEGTVRDLVGQEKREGIPHVRRVGFSNAPPAKNEALTEPLKMGEFLQFKLSGPDRGPLTLDMTLQISDIQEATKDGIVLAGRCYRLTRKLELGKQFKMVLDRDDNGDARRWLECTVTQAAAAVEATEPGPLPR